VARMSLATALDAGVADGDKVTIATDRGAVTVPVVVVPMADQVVWLPAAGLPEADLTGTDPLAPSAGVPYPGSQSRAGHTSSTIRAQLGAGHGATVTLRRPE